MSYICDVTTIEHEGDFTSLGICYCVWYGGGICCVELRLLVRPGTYTIG